MSKKFIVIFISFLIILVGGGVIFTVQQNHQARAEKSLEIYMLSGGNNDISINNGLIVITPDLQKFIGGELVFEKGLLNVNYLTTTFYYMKDGEERVILGNAISIKGGGENFTKLDAGSIGSEQSFFKNKSEFIKGSLYFVAEGTFTDGKSFKYKINIDVKSVN